MITLEGCLKLDINSKNTLKLRLKGLVNQNGIEYLVICNVYCIDEAS